MSVQTSFSFRCNKHIFALLVHETVILANQIVLYRISIYFCIRGHYTLTLASLERSTLYHMFAYVVGQCADFWIKSVKYTLYIHYVNRNWLITQNFPITWWLYKHQSYLGLTKICWLIRMTVILMLWCCNLELVRIYILNTLYYEGPF